MITEKPKLFSSFFQGCDSGSHMYLKWRLHRDCKQAVLQDSDNASRAAVPRELMVVVEVLAVHAQSAMSWQTQGSNKLQQHTQLKQSKHCWSICRQNGLGKYMAATSCSSVNSTRKAKTVGVHADKMGLANTRQQQAAAAQTAQAKQRTLEHMQTKWA